MPDRITSSPSISTVDRPDAQPARDHAAGRGNRPSRALSAGLQEGPGSASSLQRRTPGAPAPRTLRRTLSHSDITDRVAAFSRRFQEDQETPPAARFSITHARDVQERPAVPPQGDTAVEPTATASAAGSASNPPNATGIASETSATRPEATATTHAAPEPERTSAGSHEPQGGHGAPAHPYAVPYFVPHPGRSYASYASHAYAPHMQPWAAPCHAPYYSNWNWTAQHTHPAMASAFSPHGYAAYTQPQHWQPQPSWSMPSYHSRLVGANSRFGFTYGSGDGPVGKQMHIGFHFNGRFRTLSFGLYPSASRPFFVSTHSGRMNAMPPPVWPSAAPWHTPPAYHYGPAAHGYHAAYAVSGAAAQGQPAQVADHPGSASPVRPWHTVLGVPQEHATLELVMQRYNLKKRLLNPTTAHGKVALLELQAAYRSALETLAARGPEQAPPRRTAG
ncbi:hypothetical protein [Paraburkholderia caffeinilytica]|uniref:hypothetical protein n=1 Tax=Paraburkholderia caffeinilytica TaxID=1761016 RepID=UPI0013BEA1EE|nr:hypothetical protein [Paraburkholderia caffeinilytica]CAB3797989.1 hypothetical protein LMG28690_04637 [Paraburkholderia caffeinilytica]